MTLPLTSLLIYVTCRPKKTIKIMNKNLNLYVNKHGCLEFIQSHEEVIF